MIRVGIGGWTYEHWRGLFYPEKLPKTRELSHASRRVTSIEVNGTFYSTFTPLVFRRWAEETPDDFISFASAIIKPCLPQGQEIPLGDCQWTREPRESENVRPHRVR